MVDGVPDDSSSVYYTDANGNQIGMYASAPVTYVWKDHNMVSGYLDPELASVTVTLKSASNGIKASNSLRSSVSGSQRHHSLEWEHPD